MYVQSQSRLYSWNEVFPLKVFSNTALLLIQTSLSDMDGQIRQSDQALRNAGSPDIRLSMARLLRYRFVGFPELDMPMTLLAADRLATELEDENCTMSLSQMWDAASEVNHRLYDELEARGSFFYVPIKRAKLFSEPEPFGSAVSKKFPKLTEDIQEAAKCYCAGRYTACVFHLMRIMEHSVQRLGKTLKVNIEVEKENWQVILNSINAQIKTLNHKLPRTKKLGEIANHLYNVKIAWRNEVMHPKATYTEEEAEVLLHQVGVFIKSLCKIV